MRVGVLGGGLQGCCTALALAERGAEVILFDKNDALLSRVAVANEGKIHLGYMYAGDPTLSTAKTGRYAERISHYNVLSTLLAIYGLPTFAKAATAPPISAIWEQIE